MKLGFTYKNSQWFALLCHYLQFNIFANAMIRGMYMSILNFKYLKFVTSSAYEIILGERDRKISLLWSKLVGTFDLVLLQLSVFEA